jgi:hypothetical protein
MRRTYGVIRILILACFFLVGIQFSKPAYGDDSRVYLESDCLHAFGANRKIAAVESTQDLDQTFVEEDRGFVSFDRVTVIEKRKGAVTESYVQVRNCRIFKSGQAAE